MSASISINVEAPRSDSNNSGGGKALSPTQSHDSKSRSQTEMNDDDNKDKTNNSHSNNQKSANQNKGSSNGNAKGNSKNSNQNSKNSNQAKNNSNNNNNKNNKNNTNSKNSNNSNNSKNNNSSSNKKDESSNKGGGSSNSSSNANEVKQTCEACGEEFTELHYCVHCATSVCFKCRAKHVEMQVQDFNKTREDTTASQKSASKKIQKLTAMGDELQRSQTRALNNIESDFKELEKILAERKKVLIKDVKRKYQEQIKPLNEQKRCLEQECSLIDTKYENITRNLPLPPSSASLSTHAKIKNPDFALICGSAVKCGECCSSYGDLKSKTESAIENVKLIEYDSTAGAEELTQRMEGHGEVKYEEKEEEQKEDEQKGEDENEKKDEKKDKEEGGRKSGDQNEKEENENGADDYEADDYEKESQGNPTRKSTAVSRTSNQ